MIFFQIIILLIFLFFLVVALFDAVPFVKDILNRRGMGRFNSSEEWLSKAEETVLKWLSKGVPVVPKNYNERLRFIDIVKGNYKGNAIQSWQEGSVLLSANEFSPEKAEDFIEKVLSEKDRFNSGRVDIAMLAFAIMNNKKISDEKIKILAEKIAQLLLKKYDETGSIPYGGNSNILFVDTIGLVCPFLAEYAVKFNDKKAMTVAIKIIEEYYLHGFHKELKLPIHCFDKRNDAPIGIYGWGRGCAWWATGLADTYRSIENASEFKNEKEMLLNLIDSFAETMAHYQSENGAFDRNLLLFSGEDSSATAMLAYFLSLAGKITGKDEYFSSAQRAMKYIYSVTRKDGTVDWSQGDTMGAGFYSTASIVVPAAQGFAIRAYLMLREVNKVD
ncbi:MAG: glycoside hydrolase family 88 protein [Clostridia bacterium]|nr:glycoside hydrolase family 88 protein [Clostridia bacterium]